MSKKEYIKLLFEDCLIDSGKLYFFEKEFNCLAVLDFNIGIVTLLGCIPDEESESERLSVKLIKVEEEIYLIPMNAENIWVYNLNDNTWISVPLGLNTKSKVFGKFFQAIQYQEQIYLIGCGYPAIGCLNIKDKSIYYIDYINDKLKKKHDELQDCYIRVDYVQRGSQIYFASCISNQILRFEMDTKRYEWIDVGNMSNRYAGIAWDGENFWLAPRRNSTIIKWNGTNKIQEFNLLDCFKIENFYFLGIVYDGNRMCLPGMFDNKTVFFDPKNPTDIEVVEGKYLAYKVYDDYIVSLKVDGYLNIQEKGQTVYLGEISVSRDEAVKNYNLLSVNHENKVMNIYSLMENILKDNTCCDVLKYKQNVGNTIFEEMKGL